MLPGTRRFESLNHRYQQEVLKLLDQDCVLESLSLHSKNFERMPKTYGADRGMWGQPNLELCLSAGIDKIAIQPRGRAKALVSRRDLQTLSNRRIAVEARISHLKRRGLGKSRMKSDAATLAAGYGSVLGFNVRQIIRHQQGKMEKAS